MTIKPPRELSSSAGSFLERLHEREKQKELCEELKAKQGNSPNKDKERLERLMDNKKLVSAAGNSTQYSNIPYLIDINSSQPASAVVWGMSKMVQDAEKALADCKHASEWPIIAMVHGAYRQTAYATLGLLMARNASDPGLRMEATNRLRTYSALLVNSGYPLIHWMRTQAHVRLICKLRYDIDRNYYTYAGCVLSVNITTKAGLDFYSKAYHELTQANKIPSEQRNFPVDPHELEVVVKQVLLDTGHPY